MKQQIAALIATLSSLSWWFTVVVVGLVVNIVAAFLKPWLEGLWARAISRQLAYQAREDALARSLSRDAAESLDAFIDAECKFVALTVTTATLAVGAVVVGGVGCVASLINETAPGRMSFDASLAPSAGLLGSAILMLMAARNLRDVFRARAIVLNAQILRRARLPVSGDAPPSTTDCSPQSVSPGH